MHELAKLHKARVDLLRRYQNLLKAARAAGPSAVGFVGGLAMGGLAVEGGEQIGNSIKRISQTWRRLLLQGGTR